MQVKHSPSGSESSQRKSDAEGQFEEILECCDCCKVFLDIMQARVTIGNSIACDECIKLIAETVSTDLTFVKSK